MGDHNPACLARRKSTTSRTAAASPASRHAGHSANKELLFKAVLLVLIGLGVLLSPYFITSPGMQGIVAKATAVGWFALVLGAAFAGVYVKRRMA